MPKMKKGNRVLTAGVEDKNFYLDQGYDEVVFNSTSKTYDVVTKATGGKIYTIKQYNAVNEKLEAIKIENEELKKKFVTLKEENKKLKEDNKKLKG